MIGYISFGANICVVGLTIIYVSKNWQDSLREFVYFDVPALQNVYAGFRRTTAYVEENAPFLDVPLDEVNGLF